MPIKKVIEKKKVTAAEAVTVQVYGKIPKRFDTRIKRPLRYNTGKKTTTLRFKFCFISTEKKLKELSLNKTRFDLTELSSEV